MNTALGIDAIRSCKYLYLHSISETEEAILCLVLHEATVGEPPDEEALSREPSEKVRELLASSKAIVHRAGCRVFEVAWPSYVGYSVENESYAVQEPEESVGEGRGRLLVVYTKSLYLDYLAKATFASVEYPGPFSHWAIHCLDHIVNVASIEQPIIRVHNGT